MTFYIVISIVGIVLGVGLQLINLPLILKFFEIEE